MSGIEKRRAKAGTAGRLRDRGVGRHPVGGPPFERRSDPLTGMSFVFLPGGQFDMGTPLSEPQREPQETLHRVTITRGFYIATHEVTQREWGIVMGSHPSHFTACSPDCPVEAVTLFDVERLIARLDERSDWPGFRLPPRPNGSMPAAPEARRRSALATIGTDAANYDGTFPYAGGPRGKNRQMPTPVGTFAPNRWGSSICPATSGNGRATITAPTRTAASPIRPRAASPG